MGHTLLCVLALFLLSTLLYGQDEGGDAVLESPAFTVFEGDSVTMRCKHHNRRNKMKAAFFKDISRVENHQSRGAEMTIHSVSKSDEGKYACEFGDGAKSEAKELRVEAQRRVVTLRADETTVPVRGHVTLTCDVEDATGLENLWIRYTSDSSKKPVDIKNGYQYDISHGGSYTCQGWRREPDFFTSQSNAVIIQETVSNKATVTLQPNWPKIFSGEKMTLRCEIQGGGDTGWTYEWSTTSGYTRPTQKDYIISSATENHSGKYRCVGRRDSYFIMQWSDVITLEVLSYTPWARLSAVNRDIPVGGSVTLICSVSPSSSSGWTYFWYRGEKTSELLASQDIVFLSDGKISVSQGGLYWCRGGRGDPVCYTEYSGSIRVNKINIPQPVLTVSPLWLSPGASVTLNCSVKYPSAGWRFFWYKAVPRLSDSSYSYELIPDSINGTEQDSYIVDGQTHTAGYVCRAGRGDPVYYTHYSEPKFVLSGDVHSSASLTVSPNRVQHFTTDSVSLNCEGNSTEWRVKKLTESGSILFCQNWGTMTGSTCSIKRYQPSNAVYWCESGSGEFSNAVNITISSKDIILVSPVHPVTEGDSVSLSCRIRSQTFASKVFFYRNDKLIQNDTRRELNISAMSKSDEGFYKCKYSTGVSAQSWMSVKGASRPESSSFPIPMIIRLVFGIVVVILLPLLYCFTPSKDSCFIRPVQSESTNRGSAAGHLFNQKEAQQNEDSSPLHGEAHLYESIKGSDDTDNGKSTAPATDETSL
ncbi:obscurin-like [Epinephelus moara]|uniref:obscurin-like n=1 Tax=Epinephelus moara TaxID=300413 RepID=UPI00214DF54A|nr:obscurin-like [Epinephelus moara]